MRINLGRIGVHLQRMTDQNKVRWLFIVLWYPTGLRSLGYRYFSVELLARGSARASDATHWRDFLALALVAATIGFGATIGASNVHSHDGGVTWHAH